MNLFIIGNGFDLAHGLPTKYWDFRCFLEEHHGSFLRDFEEKYSLWGEDIKTFLWNDLEFNLAKLSEDILIEEMYQSTDLGLDSGNIGIEDTLNYHFKQEYQYVEKLTLYLKEWIEVVNQELGGLNRKTSLIDENHQDIFINFNYTTILEDVYNLLERNVLHIHGIVTQEDELVLGHSDSSQIDYFSEKYMDSRNKHDEQSAPIYKTLADYCSKTYKDVERYIPKLSSMNFEAVEKIIIVGHSLGNVDLPYFEVIKERINRNVQWHVYYYDVNQINTFREKLIQLGIDEHEIEFIHCDSFYDQPQLAQI